MVFISNPEITNEELLSKNERKDIFRWIFQELWYIYSSPFEITLEKIKNSDGLYIQEYKELEQIFSDANFLKKAHEFFSYRIIFQGSQEALKRINLDVTKILEQILFQWFLLLIKQRVFDATSEYVVFKNDSISLYKNKEKYFLSSIDGVYLKEFQWVNLFSKDIWILFLQENNTWKKFDISGNLVDENTYDFLITAHFHQTGFIKVRQKWVEKLLSRLWVVKHEAKNQYICYDEKVGQFYHYDANFPVEKDFIANEK